MKILFVHSHYKNSGGEEVVFSSEKKMLRDYGHNIIEYTDDNKRISSTNNVTVAFNSVWSTKSYSEIRELIKSEKPDLAHFHNIFPLISPSAYYACKRAGIPVVQTLHNYRFACPAATLFRNGTFCKDCVGKRFAYPGIIHKCYHDSATQTAVIAVMNLAHQLTGTWRKKVDAYIVLSKFMKEIIFSSGIENNKIMIKPNFTHHPDFPRKSSAGDYFLYVGRLAPEKGIQVLLDAWANSPLPLKIAGDGPLEDEVNSFAMISGGRVEYLKHISHSGIFDLMSKARALIVPSAWHEPFGLTIIEAFASNLAVIASNHEPINSIVTNGKTGLLYSTNDAQGLMLKAEWAWQHPAEMLRMGLDAHGEYLEKYTADINYARLMDIYSLALRNNGEI